MNDLSSVLSGMWLGAEGGAIQIVVMIYATKPSGSTGVVGKVEEGTRFAEKISQWRCVFSSRPRIDGSLAPSALSTGASFRAFDPWNVAIVLLDSLV